MRSLGGIARATVRSIFLGNVITIAIINGRSRMISAPRGIGPLEMMQPLSTTRMRHPSDKSIAGYGPLESSFSGASGIAMVMQVAVLLGCVPVDSKGI